MFEEWKSDQLKFNDEKIRTGKVCYPMWYITSKKRVKVEHNFDDGSTFVLLEQVLNRGDVNCLKLDVVEWADVRFKLEQFGCPFVSALEGKGEKTVEELFKYWTVQKYKDWCSCRIPVNDDIRLTFKWSTVDKASYYIDVRRGVIKTTPPSSDDEDELFARRDDTRGDGDNARPDGRPIRGVNARWEGGPHGLALGGNTLKFFLENITPKVCFSLQKMLKGRSKNHQSCCFWYIFR